MQHDDQPSKQPDHFAYFGGPKDGDTAPIAAEVRHPVISSPGDDHVYTPGLTGQGRRAMVYRGIRPVA